MSEKSSILEIQLGNDDKIKWYQFGYIFNRMSKHIVIKIPRDTIMVSKWNVINLRLQE